jgi:hypothetical protein
MWKPDSTKITDFGKYWRVDQYIPELTDAVKGEATPAVATTFGALNSASARIFAEIENNLAYMDRIMVFENMTITVGSVAQLVTMNDALDKISYIHKGATITINIAAGTYTWTSTATAPIQIHDIHGGGKIQINGGFTIQANNLPAAGDVVSIKNCAVKIEHNTGTLTVAVNTAVAARAFKIEFCRIVALNDIEIKCLGTNTLTTGVYCYDSEFFSIADLKANTNNGGGVDTGIDYLLNATVNSHVLLITATLGKIKNTLYSLSFDSTLLFFQLDNAIPTGANMATLSGGPVNVGDSSQIKALAISGTGAGTKASPYLVTVANEGADNTSRYMTNFIAALPRPLDVHVRLNLPGTTITRTTATPVVEFKDLTGRGSVTLKGAGGSGTGLTTILDTVSFTAAVKIERCETGVILDLIAGGSNATTGNFVKADFSRDVLLSSCYADTGTGSAVVAYGNGTRLQIENSIVGAYTTNGLDASRGAVIICINSVAEGGGGAPWPGVYGNHAELGGSIFHNVASSTFVKGSGGTDHEVTGGKVFSS